MGGAHLLPILAATAYLCASLFYPIAFRRPGGVMQKVARLSLLAGFIFQLGFIALFIVGAFPLPVERGPWERTFTFPVVVSLPGLILCGGFLAVERKQEFGSLGALLAPLVCLFMLLSSFAFHWGTRGADLPQEQAALVVFHVASSVVADILFSLAFLFAAAFILRETLIKRKNLAVLRMKFFALETLDRFQSGALGLAMICMAAGLVSGFVVAASHDVQSVGSDPRFVWSLALFVFYGMVLALRFGGGIRGIRGSWLSVAGFAILVASLVTVRLGSTFHGY